MGGVFTSEFFFLKYLENKQLRHIEEVWFLKIFLIFKNTGILLFGVGGGCEGGFLLPVLSTLFAEHGCERFSRMEKKLSKDFLNFCI